MAFPFFQRLKQRVRTFSVQARHFPRTAANFSRPFHAFVREAAYLPKELMVISRQDGMAAFSSYSQPPIPTAPRLRLDLPCVINLADAQIEAQLCNISYQGLAVRLPEGQPPFELAQMQSVTISGIGEFAVATRWRKDGKIGLAFLSKRGARPLLDAYFAKTGEYPI
ncbi:PilZ domain-containing protein [Leisingera sp. D0M16]|uniref:PilZ domain-containing protein n=1 Tax=Leisingera coralii TaxID=3351347 RepID=UPI003B79423A